MNKFPKIERMTESTILSAKEYQPKENSSLIEEIHVLSNTLEQNIPNVYGAMMKITSSYKGVKFNGAKVEHTIGKFSIKEEDGLKVSCDFVPLKKEQLTILSEKDRQEIVQALKTSNIIFYDIGSPLKLLDEKITEKASEVAILKIEVRDIQVNSKENNNGHLGFFVANNLPHFFTQ